MQRNVKSSFSVLTQSNEDGEDEMRGSGEEEGIRCWMGREGDWKKATDSRRHQCRAAPPPAGGSSSGAKGTNRGEQERRNSPSFLKLWLRPRSWLSPMKMSKTDWQPHTRTPTQGEFSAECRVMTEVDEDVKSLTAAIRLGGSETREERQKAERRETTEGIWDVNGCRGGMKEEPSAFCCTVSPLASFSSVVWFCSLPGRVGMCVWVRVCGCVCVFPCVQRDFMLVLLFPMHLQCLVNSRKQFGWEWWKEGEESDSHTERETTERKSERMIERVHNRRIQSL